MKMVEINLKKKTAEKDRWVLQKKKFFQLDCTKLP